MLLAVAISNGDRKWVNVVDSYYIRLRQGGFVFAFVCLSVGRITRIVVAKFDEIFGIAGMCDHNETIRFR